MNYLAASSVADNLTLALGAPSNRARGLLHRHGLRATAPRLAVIAALASIASPGHCTATELLELVNRNGLDVNPTTIYRTVTTMEDKGILHQVAMPDGTASYGLADHPHHHAICSRCSSITEIPVAEFAGALEAAHRGSLFTFASTGSITLHGLCPDCQTSGLAQPLPDPGHAAAGSH